MRSSSAIGAGTALLLVVLIGAPGTAGAQEAYQFEIIGFEAEVIGASELRLVAEVVNLGDEPSPPSVARVLWEGQEIGSLELPGIDNGQDFQLGTLAVVPQDTGQGEATVQIVVDGAVRAEATVVVDLGGAGGTNWWPVAIGGGVAGIAAGGWEWARRLRRRRWEDAATDRPPGGRCRPGYETTTRSCRPQPQLRKLQGLSMRAIDESGRQEPVAAEFGRHSRAARALAAALTARRRGDDEHMAEKLDEGAARLVGAIDGTLRHASAAWTVQLAGGYEGSGMQCTFERWRCAPDGTWPAGPHRQWSATAADAGTIPIGTLAGCGRRDSNDLIAELRPLLGAFIAAVSEGHGSD